MVQLDLKLVSLNINGLGNPIKRAKVMAKLKMEEVHVIYLRETHLSREEHEKLKRFGYKNTYYTSYSQTRRRGVATLISNKIKLEFCKDIKDKEGRYAIVKGKVEGNMVTLINVYAPPDSDKHFFKSLFDVIALETEGVCICGGDFNVILQQNIDTTILKNNKNKLTKLINTAWEDMGFLMSGGTLTGLRGIILITQHHT